MFGSSTVNSTASEDSTDRQLDYGVILYACSFAVIFLMILSQAKRSEGARERGSESERAEKRMERASKRRGLWGEERQSVNV